MPPLTFVPEYIACVTHPVPDHGNFRRGDMMHAADQSGATNRYSWFNAGWGVRDAVVYRTIVFLSILEWLWRMWGVQDE